MYCKNCGNEIDPNAAICVKCGYQKGTGANYCAHCGATVTPGASVCMGCGYALTEGENVDPSQQKSKLVAGLLGIFLGGLGIHNFYLGYTGKGVLQILLNFCFGVGYIWGLIEGILILCGKINKDAKGNPLKD